MVFRNKVVNAEETGKRVVSGEQEPEAGGWVGAGPPGALVSPILSPIRIGGLSGSETVPALKRRYRAAPWLPMQQRCGGLGRRPVEQDGQVPGGLTSIPSPRSFGEWAPLKQGRVRGRQHV